MNNKSIIKNYEQTCALLSKDKSEEAKQRFLIIFKELDLQLNKDLASNIEKLSYTASNLREEIRRIEAILSYLSYRREVREKMTNDYRSIIGYNPKDLEEIPHIDDEKDYVAYKTNLIVANEIISSLIKSGKRVSDLKKQLSKRGKKKEEIEKSIESIQKSRSEKLEELRSNTEVLNDLYDYCITAPFNEENAYIQYIMIKMNPNGVLKVNVNRTPTRQVKKQEVEVVDTKPMESMPMVPNLGSVRPNNILKYMEDTIQKFDDINIPTNGLIDNTTNITVNSKDITKEQ